VPAGHSTMRCSVPATAAGWDRAAGGRAARGAPGRFWGTSRAAGARRLLGSMILRPGRLSATSYRMGACRANARQHDGFTANCNRGARSPTSERPGGPSQSRVTQRPYEKVYLAYDGLLNRDVAFALIRTEGLGD